MFKRTKEAFGGIDIVVNNAGIGGETDENWEQTVDVNMVRCWDRLTVDLSLTKYAPIRWCLKCFISILIYVGWIV